MKKTSLVWGTAAILFAVMFYVESVAQVPGIAVELTAPDGTPAHGGYIRAYPNPPPADWEGFARNFDIANGKCLIPLAEPEKLNSFMMIVYADGFAPYHADWNDLKADPVPGKYAITLLPAVTVGGYVVDEQDNPIEGVKVQFIVNWGGQSRNNKSDGFVCAIRMETDAEGRWSSSNVRREELDARKNITMAHPDYANVGLDSILLRAFLPDSAGNFTQKTVVLKKGETFTGIVVDEQGNPVEDVRVFTNVIRLDINYPDMTRTDAKGEFKFENCAADPGRQQLYIGVCKDGFAPDMITFARITPSVNPARFELKPGQPLGIRVVDAQGNGIPDASISPAKWRGVPGRVVRFWDNDRGYVQTDEEGRFVWENAPSDEFLLSIEKSGYMSGRDVSVKLGGEENVFTLRPHMIVDCKVFDAETKEPIPTLQVMYGIGKKIEWDDQKVFWSSILNPGQLTQTPEGFQYVQRQPVEDFGRWLLRVDVEGYETCISEPLQENTDRQTLEFALVRKKPDAENPDLITGTIFTPDGNPAEGVQVGFATTQRHAQVDNGRIIHNANVTVRTDASGTFRLSKLNTSINEQDYKLMFLHDSGFATIRKAEFEERNEPITLMAWGRIEGTIYTGKETAKDAWAAIAYSPEDDRDWERPWIMYNYRIPCDANGRFVFDRVFPGKGKVAQSIEINNGGGWRYSHLQPYEIKPGETLNVKIGGGGYAVQGQIGLPTKEDGEKVDWRFASVTAELTYPERIAFAPSVGTSVGISLLIYLQNAPEMNTGRLPDPDNREKVIRRWEESPEGKEFIAKNPELYEKEKQAVNATIEWERRRQRAWNSRVTCVVSEHGMFQLDDLSPGDWTLEVTLNWTKVPGQPWEFADVWEKKMGISIPELPGGPPDEPMMIGPIAIGHDPSDRKGPRR